MIHYAALPLELIFQGYESYSPRYLRIPFARGAIVVEPLSPMNARIVQLISSNPQDYLNPRLQPGLIIDLPAAGLQEEGGPL